MRYTVDGAREHAPLSRGAPVLHSGGVNQVGATAPSKLGATGSGRRAARTDTPVQVDSAEPTQRPFHRGARSAAPGAALSDGCVNAKSTAFSVRLHAGGRPPIAAATFRAMADLVPDGLPFLSPAERQAAGFADLFRQVRFVGHRDSRAEKEPCTVAPGGSVRCAAIRRTHGHRRAPHQCASSPSSWRRSALARVRGSSQIAKNARANAGSVTSAVRRPLV